MLKHTPGYAFGFHRPRESGLMGEVLATMTPITKTASTPSVDEPMVQKLAFDLGIQLTRVAGNIYEQPATRDFWAVKGGKLVRLTGTSTSVDDGERLDPADVDDPENTLNTILADLEF